MKRKNVFLILGAGCLIAGIITINVAPYWLWLQKAFLGVAIPSAIGAWIMENEYPNKIKKFLKTESEEGDEK